MNPKGGGMTMPPEREPLQRPNRGGKDSKKGLEPKELPWGGPAVRKKKT